MTTPGTDPRRARSSTGRAPARAPDGARTTAGTGRGGPAPRKPRQPARDRARRRHRRLVVLVLVLAAGALIGVDLVRNGARTGAGHAAARDGIAAGAPAAPRPTPQPGPTGAPTPAASFPPAAPTTAPTPAAPTPTPNYPIDGPGTFGYAPDEGAVLGSAGTLRRFRVAVENGMGQDPATFAAAADTILGDSRSWIASGQLRLQHVPQAAAADFTLFLATPATSERMCAAGGLRTERFTSCRLPGQVIINVARWQEAVPDYGAPLDVYRAYVINHEVGHELGYGHEACPSSGRPAPVMQQQTYGLEGCLANSWPYVDGRRYAGPDLP